MPRANPTRRRDRRHSEEVAQRFLDQYPTTDDNVAALIRAERRRVLRALSRLSPDANVTALLKAELASWERPR